MFIIILDLFKWRMQLYFPAFKELQIKKKLDHSDLMSTQEETY